jgi:hypothetical protein
MRGKGDRTMKIKSAATDNGHDVDAFRRGRAYLTEAQRLSQTGSFGWNVLKAELFWSEETFRIFEYDRTITPIISLVLGRVHPDDRSSVQKAIDLASSGGTAVDPRTSFTDARRCGQIRSCCGACIRG